jgi:hypothetical protein
MVEGNAQRSQLMTGAAVALLESVNLDQRA